MHLDGSESIDMTYMGPDSLFQEHKTDGMDSNNLHEIDWPSNGKRVTNCIHEPLGCERKVLKFGRAGEEEGNAFGRRLSDSWKLTNACNQPELLQLH